MTLWIAWSVLISALLAAAAVVLELAASYLGAPRRFVWIAALLAATVVPVALAARHAPVVEAPLSSAKALTTPGAIGSIALSGQPPAETHASVLQTLAAWANLAHRADRWLVLAWLSASAVLMSLFVHELICLRRRRSDWETVDTDVGVVLVSRNIGPAVVGFFHPRIVVPSWTLSTDRTTRELLYRHELEHIRAGDMRALLASELALIFMPWNAALWWMTRRLRLAIELDCDARVVRATGGAHAYGSVLLSVGERHAASMPLTTSFSGTKLNLEVRINAMTAPRKRHPIAAALPLTAIALGVLATAAWMPRPVPLVPARARQGQEPRVTLSLDNAPIANVLSEFAKFSHRTILAPPNMNGTVTAEIRDQPWRSALRSLLNATGYDFVVAADSALVVDTIDAIRQRTTVRDTTLAGVGYAFRKQAGAGFFLDGDQLDPRATAFSDMVRTVPGFRIAPSADGRTHVISDAQSLAGGCVNVFVDGSLWQTTIPGDIDSAVRPAQVVAVEAYKSASTPPQFAPQNQAGCATIVVWTRARVRPD